MKTKYLISILAAVALFINVNAQDRIVLGPINLGPFYDSYLFEDISSDFYTDYPLENSYIYDVPVQTSVNDLGATIVNIPLELPDAGSGLKPDLALSYNSMKPESMFGNGWEMAGLSEIRRMVKSFYYDGIMRNQSDDDDIDGTEAFSLNGSRLVILENNFPVSVSYQTETGNVKVKAHFDQQQQGYILRNVYSYFEVLYPNGKTAIFGFDDLEQNNSQLSFPTTKISDRLGNEVIYDYVFSSGKYLIKNVSFGKNQSEKVEFNYKNQGIAYGRTISTGTWQSGEVAVDTTYLTQYASNLLRSITIKNNDVISRNYIITYHSNGEYIFLSGVQLIKPKSTAVQNYAFGDNEIAVIPDSILYLPNDTVDFAPPIRFLYSENSSEELKKTAESLVYNHSDLNTKKGMFSSKQTSGIVIYPKTDPFWENPCPANANIVIKPNLNKPDSYTLQAGEGFLDILCTDIDGIAGDEIVKINNTYTDVVHYDEDGFSCGTIFSDILTFEVYTVNAAGELIFLYTRQFTTGFERDGNKLINKQFFPGDFDGNGRNEIFAVSALKTETEDVNPVKPRGEIYDLENEKLIYQGSMFDNITIPTPPPYIDPHLGTPISLDIDPNGIMVTGDFNGNEICDFLYIPGKNTNGALLEFVHSDSTLELRKLGICEDVRIILPGEYLTGDFNGDGRTDLFDTSRGLVSFSDGKTLTAYLLDMPNSFRYVSTEDLNGDGQSDITFVGDYNTNAFFFSEGAIMARTDAIIGVPYGYTLANGNYSGYETGKKELVFINGDSIIRLSYGLDLSRTLLLTGVKSGFGTITDFEYSALDSDGVYTQSKDIRFPYQNLNPNLFVACKMRTSYNDELMGVKTFSYENGVLNKQRLDFWGFEKITVFDSIRNQSVVKTLDPMNFGMPIQIESPAAKTVNTYNVSIADNKIAKITLTSSEQIDKLKNTTVNKSYAYDDYGDVTKETIDYGGGIKRITDNSYNNYDMETLYRLGELAYTNITSYAPLFLTGNPGGPIVLGATGNTVNSLSITTPGFGGVPIQQVGASTIAKIDILYNDKGLPIDKTTWSNGAKVLEEISAYSNSADLLSLGVKPYDETSTLKKTYEYDNCGRVTKETDPANNSIEYLYSDNGLLEQTTDIYGNATDYAYDNFGRLTTTTSPLNSVTNVKYQWIDATNTAAPAGAVYSVTTTTEKSFVQLFLGGTPGSGIETLALGGGLTPINPGIITTLDNTIIPETTVYYDALGREIRSEQVRFDASLLKIDKQYDTHGRLWKVSAPFKGDAPTLWDVYIYDDFDRPTSIVYASGKQDKWSYDGNSVTTQSDGIETTKTYNAAGQLTKVADAGGTITYDYFPDGQLGQITTNKAVTSFTYDTYGRRLSITDPSAGTETVTYNSSGNIASYKDAKNQMTTFSYDNLFRLTAKQMPEYTINYGYDAKGNLNNISSNGGQSLINYTFDNFGRISAEAETFEGKTLAKQYAYSGDRLSSKTYLLDNTTITTENYYYANGYQTETRLDGSKSVWKITAENERGQATTALTGNFTRTYGFDAFGMPTLRKIQLGNTVVQNFSCNFDAATGNLLSRSDNKRGITENFGYDNLNRLTNFNGSSASYGGNGNILEKNDMSYSYNIASKPYAVSQIDQSAIDSPNLVSSVQQLIEYTSFKRPFSITSGDTLYQFAYNGINQRTKMFSNIATKIYLGNCYEKDQTGGNTKEKLYLCGDYYSSHAVMVRENNGAWQLYYIGRDYLGSVTNVTNENGSIGYEYSYDAWGNLRNPDTQALYAQDEQPNLFLGRGFTGHEHLPFCNLINMNARLYDPAVGRFLSPDPYVQSSDFSQGYNRYSYCLNNPLRYTDPTGENYYSTNNPDLIKQFLKDYSDGDGSLDGYDFDGWDEMSDLDFLTNYRNFISRFTSDSFYDINGFFIGTNGLMTLNARNNVACAYISSLKQERRGSGTFNDPYQLKELVVTGNSSYKNTFGYLLFGDLVSGKIDDGGYGPYTGPGRRPDFWSLSASFPISEKYGWLGVGGTLTIDRYGHFYVSLPEISAGKTSFWKGIAVSVTANWMDQTDAPTAEETHDFLSGFAINAGGGWWVGFNWTYSIFNNGTQNAYSIGFFTPQVGAGISYTFKVK